MVEEHQTSQMGLVSVRSARAQVVSSGTGAVDFQGSGVDLTFLGAMMLVCCMSSAACPGQLKKSLLTVILVRHIDVKNLPTFQAGALTLLVPASHCCSFSLAGRHVRQGRYGIRSKAAGGGRCERTAWALGHFALEAVKVFERLGHFPASNNACWR